jgi:hypothetical protein
MRRFIVLALLAVPALAHAECGWLLMVPPSLTASTHVDPRGGRGESWGFPAVAVWGQSGAYDSASACEADRRALVRWRSNEVHDPDVVMDRVRRGEYGALSLAEQAYARVVWARCLPASQVPVR